MHLYRLVKLLPYLCFINESLLCLFRENAVNTGRMVGQQVTRSTTQMVLRKTSLV